MIFLTGSEQWIWIKSDLAAVNRSITPWLIVLGHRPYFTSSAGQQPTNIAAHLRQHLFPLYLKYGVDVIMVGHMHKYERTCGMIAPFVCGKRDEDGIVNLLVGTAGNTFQVPWDTYGDFQHHNQPPWSIFRSAQWGISELEVNSTSLSFSYIGSQRGDIHDQLVLRK